METTKPDDDVKRPVFPRSAAWCQYLALFQHSKVKDRALAAFIRDVMLMREPLEAMVTRVQGGRRVFLQQSARGEVPYIVFPILLDIDQPDLAFRVVLAHSMWNDVLELFNTEGVTQHSRNLAFKKALRQSRWKVVLRMIRSEVSVSDRNKRMAFLQMIRREEVSLAAELCEEVSCLINGDLVFAIRACLRLGRMDVVMTFVKRLTSLDKHRNLLSRVVRESIAAGKIDNFLELVDGMVNRTTLDGKFLRTLFRVSLERQQLDFVLEFVQRSFPVEYLNNLFMYQTSEIENIAVEAAVFTEQTDSLEKMLDIFDFNSYPGRFLTLFQLSLKSRKGRKICCPLLERWCVDELDDLVDTVSQIRCLLSDSETGMTHWCFNRSLYRLSFLVALATGDYSMVRQIMDTFGGSMDTDIVACSLDFIPTDDTDSVAAVLAHLSVDSVDICQLGESENMHQVIQACGERRLTKWVVHLAIFVNNWDVIEAEMRQSSDVDVSLIDHVVDEASSSQQWVLVRSLLDRCSQTPNVLLPVLRGVMLEDDPSEALDMARLLLKRVDLSSSSQTLYNSMYCRSLLQDAVESQADREAMVKLFISAGISTYEPHFREILLQQPFFIWSVGESAMRRAYRNGQLPLVRLLHQSGATCNEELHELKSNQGLRTKLEGQGRDDIVRYMTQVASSPRSLQDLCRLEVSHLIGCSSGRARRVQSLELTETTKELVMFKDIL